ncbi:phosphotransferase [bacterium]|nr:phosphotransferase [bacterium]
MHALILADNLTNDYCSPETEFRDNILNIGIDEYERLFGGGEQHGEGVLPAVLRLAQESDGQTGIVLLRDCLDPDEPEHREILLRYGDHGIKDSRGYAFLPSLESLSSTVTVLETGSLALPLQAFSLAFEGLTGQRIEEQGKQEWKDTRILLVGVHTEKRLLNTAHILRHVFGFRHVAVTPHLVGSANRDAHFTALRYRYPDILVDVIPELADALAWVGLDPSKLPHKARHACSIGPTEIREALSHDQRRIVEAICMHWTRTELKPLKGGFSGSFLFLANGWKGEALTEPMVMKIDSFHSIRRELKGYERVKDLLGKHVPTISPPVSFGEFTGIGMELATMEGSPSTLQDLFEAATDDARLERFLNLLRRTLSLLAHNMYGNTGRRRHVAPYRQFMLHIRKQSRWLQGNIESLHRQRIKGTDTIDTDMVVRMFDLVRKNDDGLETVVCLSHGDLNLANLICDNIGNTWAIDWTHADNHPLELDFAKLENDIKFVIGKDFQEEDFIRLQRFEECVLDTAILPDINEMPASLRFIAWDIRFKRMYLAVRAVRETYFSLRDGDEWLMYRIALLKYAIHTLSFDRSRDRGECGPVQLWYALASAESLLFQLVADDFQLKIRGERPSTYPPRQRVSIDEADWRFESRDYNPPYNVEPEVLAHSRGSSASGWADPEDDFSGAFLVDGMTEIMKGEDGKPLNPSGRTGIAGRGALGRWGPNPVVLPVITRVNAHESGLELLLCDRGEEADDLPEDFVNFGEETEEVLRRYVDAVLDADAAAGSTKLLYQDYLYDARQTDNAWIYAYGFLLHTESETSVQSYKPWCTLRWTELTPELINRFSTGKAAILRSAVESLLQSGRVKEEIAMEILRKSG